MKVVTKYTIDDCIFIANHINQKNKVSENGWVQLYSYFFYVNCFAFSALLFFLGYYWVGIIVFLINLSFFLFLSDKANKENYKAHYQSFFSENEFQEIEVELLEDGIVCKSEEGESFDRWKNLKEIIETQDKIYFFNKFNGISISKNSFEYEPQMQEFLIFAKARIPQNLFK